MIEIDAVLFDLDGTLVDSQKDLARSVQWLQRSLGQPESTQREVGTFIGDGVVKLVHRAVPSLHGAHLHDAVERFKLHYRHHCLDYTRDYPGVRKTLAALRHKRLAVVTNKPWRASCRILRGLDLMKHFGAVIGGDSLPQKKPNPLPLWRAMYLLGVRDPRRVVMVGDGPADVWGGRRAGVWTCGIPSGLGRSGEMLAAKPDVRITRLTELLRWFK